MYVMSEQSAWSGAASVIPLTRFGDGTSDGSCFVVRQRNTLRGSTRSPSRFSSSPRRLRPMSKPASRSEGRIATSSFFVPAQGFTSRSCRTRANIKASLTSLRERAFAAL